MKALQELNIYHYDTQWNKEVKFVAPVTDDAIVHFELMSSHYCKLAFKVAKPIAFALGDFIETPKGRFEIIELSTPKVSGLAYSYEIQFDAYYRKWKNRILKYLPNTGSPETSFSLTAAIGVHGNVILDNLTALANKSKGYLYDVAYDKEGTDYVISVDSTVDASKSKSISYSSTSILDALTAISDAFECEWWIEGNIIHFGTCENTNAVTDFRLDDNVSTISESQNQNTYATRVFAFGAERNLPSDYKENESADITKNGVVQRRLMLPTLAECSDENKKLLEDNGFELTNYGCIQVKGLDEDQYVEGVTANDDIYPRNLIKANSIVSFEKEVADNTTQDPDDTITRTFYRVGGLELVDDEGTKTGDMAFRSSYKLSGQTLHIIFQSGSLNGLDFECQFNPEGKPEILRDDNGDPILKDGKEQINPESQVFEIVANEDYGRFLPDTVLMPKAGDTFVLYNWDSSKLGDTLILAASNELLADTVENLKKSMIDPTNYTCEMMADYSINNYSFVEGDRVNLYYPALKDGVRQSRIIGYELHLDIPWDGAKYIVGEKPSSSRLSSLESKVEDLTFKGQVYEGKTAGNSVYIIKSYDSVEATDYNVYSSRRSDLQYLYKTKADVSQGLITFLKGIALGADGKYGISEAGAAVLKSLVADVLQSADYDAAEESGFGFYKRADGKYGLNITDVLVWGKAIFNNLEIRNLYSVGGSIVLSPSSGKIVKVAEVTDAETGAVTGWKCWMLADDGTMATTNQWQVGDQARCQTFNVAAGVYEHVSNKDYWRRVTAVSTENEVITDDGGTVLYDGKKFAWVVLSKTDCMEGSDEPQADDTIVCMGSRTVTDRQHLIMLATEGDDAPSLTLYRGVNSYTLTGKKIFHVSYNGIEAVSQYFKWTDSSGAKVWTPTYLGTWQDGRTYGYYDEVTWMGTRWLCVAPEGTAVTEEPSENSSCWMAETAIVKPKLVLYHDLGAGISLGETHTITCRGMMGDQDITSTLTNWAVTRSTGDSVEDAAWLTRSKVKAFDGTFALTWVLDVSESDMGNGETAVFTFSAKRPSGETLSESIGITT